MTESEGPTAYPTEIRVGARGSPTVYVRRPDHYALLRRREGDPAQEAVLTLDGGSIAVFRGQADPRAVAASADATRGAGGGPIVGPVYALGPNGPLAVPTGLLFARFADGVAAESRRDELRRAGFEVVEIPSYAPNAAWLRARSGDIADALARAPALEAMPDLEAVEPQMLMESARR